VARVQEASARLGYVPDPAARALASQRSNHVAILIPKLSNTLFVDLLDAAQQTLRAGGFQTLIGVTHYDEAQEEQLLREQLLHRPAGPADHRLEPHRQRPHLDGAQPSAPCVHLMDSACAKVRWGLRIASASAKTRPALHSLATCSNAGRRQRIAFAGAQLDPRVMQRLYGWRSALQEAGSVRAHAGMAEPGLLLLGAGGRDV
jgi:LacI family transcriptional regulator, gluconate utilization system Gnt-I transcriptional repressor